MNRFEFHFQTPRLPLSMQNIKWFTDVDGCTKIHCIHFASVVFLSEKNLWGKEKYKQNYFVMQCIQFSKFISSCQFDFTWLFYSFYLFIAHFRIVQFCRWHYQFVCFAPFQTNRSLWPFLCTAILQVSK